LGSRKGRIDGHFRAYASSIRRGESWRGSQVDGERGEGGGGGIIIIPAIPEKPWSKAWSKAGQEPDEVLH
jgi:hypothetical protein